MLPIFAESYHDLKKTNKVLEDLLKAAPFFDKEIAPKGILEHIRAACSRVFVSGFAAEVEKVYTGMETVITKILKYTDKTVPEGQSHNMSPFCFDLSRTSPPPFFCRSRRSGHFFLNGSTVSHANGHTVSNDYMILDSNTEQCSTFNEPFC